MMRTLLIASLVLLSACANDPQPAHVSLHQPDNTIIVAPDAQGRLTAIGPGCAPHDPETVSGYQNDPLPQLGCSTASNLARMIANPADLVRGELPPRPGGHANAEVEAAATTRYEIGKTYPPTGYTSESGATAAQ